MLVRGMPYRHNGEEYDGLITGSVTHKIEQVRSSAKKKEWQEDRLSRARLEDWLFTVRP